MDQEAKCLSLPSSHTVGAEGYHPRMHHSHHLLDKQGQLLHGLGSVLKAGDSFVH